MRCSTYLARLLASVVVAILPLTASAQRTQSNLWTVGFRANYGTLGGGAFEFVPDVGGLTFSLSRQMNSMFSLEGGLSISLYESGEGSVDAFFNGDPNTFTSGFATLYVQPTMYFPSNGNRLVPYFGGRVGFVSGDFAHGSVGWQAGPVGGVVWPLNARVSVDLGVSANIVVTNQYQLATIRSKSPWGRMFMVQSGIMIGLGH